ncbi:MAG: bifunctional phosphopantothenoylcysteine decarboxylase/phosphopantothenate--cysteine ligase CoaBC [Candidatus Hydrothermarchaeota archaeon]
MKHPIERIKGSKSRLLENKKIVLCVTGSIAAIESPKLARELVRHGADVYSVMSPSAREIIHPNAMEFATGKRVITKLTGLVEHVSLAGDLPEKADLILVAPCTANTLSKIASGIDDTSVTTVVSTAIGSSIPILIAPAMHESMYKHPSIQENIEKIKKMNIYLVEPRIEEEKAKIANITDIVEKVIEILYKDKDLSGKKILITVGPTIEPVDPIRIITNKSSGLMGISLAKAALARGGDVTIVYGPGTVRPPLCKVINVNTTSEMYDAVKKETESNKFDIFIGAAAAADFCCEGEERKISSTKESLVVKLKRTPKIVDYVRSFDKNIFLVGFKAEYDVSDEELIERAYERLKSVDMDMIVANDVSREGVGFGTPTNEVFIIDKEKKVEHIPLTNKLEVAHRILDSILSHLR